VDFSRKNWLTGPSQTDPIGSALEVFVMSRKDEVELVPRSRHTFEAGIVCRISGCPNQKELSLEDQEDHGREEAQIYCNGPTNFTTIATNGKGERLNRDELAEIETLLRSSKLDLLVLEDLGRLVRGAEAVRLLGI